MSFKREGDDLSQLNVLRKRRVADLLASYIPEDEAVLMKNGRYACSVCFYRPVFDTVDMLAVHRTGKKHLAGMQRFYGKKRDLRLEIQKRQQQQHVREEESGAGEKQVDSELPPLLKQTRRITHHALLKAAPYSSRCNRSRLGVDEPTASSGHSSTTATPWQPQAAGAASEDTEPAGVADAASSTDTRPATSHPAREGRRPGSRGEQVERVKRKGRRKAAKTQPPSQPTPADPEKQKLAEHYLKLKSSGWIPDGCGNWVRDEAVEFDSDEEEPPPLSPP